MHEKHSDTDFDVVEHLNTRMKSGTLDSNFRMVSTTSMAAKRERKQQKSSVKSTCFKNIVYKDFEDINAMHTAYLCEIKASMSPTAFLAHLYKAELCGAKIHIKNKANAVGIVVEERENVLLVIHEDNKIKMYPKASNSFVLHHDGVRYFFFGSTMRRTRFYKK